MTFRKGDIVIEKITGVVGTITHEMHQQFFSKCYIINIQQTDSYKMVHFSNILLHSIDLTIIAIN